MDLWELTLTTKEHTMNNESIEASQEYLRKQMDIIASAASIMPDMPEEIIRAWVDFEIQMMDTSDNTVDEIKTALEEVKYVYEDYAECIDEILEELSDRLNF